jgi:hypothetical protein
MRASKFGFRNVDQSLRIVAQRKTVHVRNDPKASAGGQDVAWRKGPQPGSQRLFPVASVMGGKPARA